MGTGLGGHGRVSSAGRPAPRARAALKRHAAAADAARLAPGAEHAGGRLLRCATYNVQGRLWAGPARRTRAVEEVLDELDADVLVLQEVHPPARAASTWTSPAGAVYRVVYGPTLSKGTADYGNAVLSRHPLVAVRRVDLSVAGREPRGALEVQVDAGGTPLWIVGTHLGLRARERVAQVARLLEACGKARSGPWALLGDLNEWRPRGGALRALEDRLGRAPRVPSFPSRCPLLALDRVWVRPAGALVGLAAHRTPRSARASDHLPVVATVRTAGALPDGRTA